MSLLSIQCDRIHLLAAIQAAEAVAPSNSTKPILSNVLIDAKAAHLEIIATDSQVGLRCLVRRVDVEGIGQAVVGARQLAAILKESSSRSVQLKLETGERQILEIALADGDYTIPAVVGEPFPPVAAFPEEHTPIRLPGPRFEEMLRQTTFAMDKDRTSAVLSGLLLQIGEGEVLCAGTDGKVLGEAVLVGEQYRMGDGEKTSAVIPSVVISHLQRVLAGAKPEIIDLVLHGKLIFIRMAVEDGLQVEFTARLVEGNFPSYRVAISTPSLQTITFVASELASAVRRAALMTNNTSRGIIMSLDRDMAVFSNLNYTNGSVRISVPCGYTGAPMKFGLNAHYLADVLRAYQGERVVIEIGRGLVIRDQGATFLVMPINLPN